MDPRPTFPLCYFISTIYFYSFLFFSLFSVSYSLSFLYFTCLILLLTLFCTGFQIFEYNKLYLNIKLYFDLVPLTSNRICLKVTTFSQLTIVSSIQKFTNHIKSCFKYPENHLMCSTFENILF